MSAHLRERKNQVKSPRGDGQNPANIVVLVVFLFLGVFFFMPLFPPFGLIWCAVTGKALFKELKIQGVIKKDVEGKYSFDTAKAKTVGQRDFEKAREQYKARVSESARMEEKQPYRHPHNPVNYSYDSCATQRRLEQIKSLKEAGILDEKEYQQRKTKILAGK